MLAAVCHSECRDCAEDHGRQTAGLGDDAEVVDGRAIIGIADKMAVEEWIGRILKKTISEACATI
ncbi:MAG: hypothetical protein ACI9ZV_000554 [Candidatus Azotimanducaceae bacterium]